MGRVRCHRRHATSPLTFTGSFLAAARNTTGNAAKLAYRPLASGDRPIDESDHPASDHPASEQMRNGAGNPNSPDFRSRVSEEREVSPEIRNLVNVMFPPSHHDEDSDPNAGME